MDKLGKIVKSTELSQGLYGLFEHLDKIRDQMPQVPKFPKSFHYMRNVQPIKALELESSLLSKAMLGINQSVYNDFPYAQLQDKLQSITNMPIIEALAKIDSKFPQAFYTEYDFLRQTSIEESQTSEKIIIEADNIHRVITDIYTNNEILHRIESRKFEEIIAELLSKKGFNVELTQQTRDGGFDIIALHNQNGFPMKYVVECKRNAVGRPIGIGIVRGFCNVIQEEKANKGIIVTSSYFTKPSWERQAKEGHLLDLVDREGFLSWVHDYLKSAKY